MLLQGTMGLLLALTPLTTHAWTLPSTPGLRRSSATTTSTSNSTSSPTNKKAPKFLTPMFANRIRSNATDDSNATALHALIQNKEDLKLTTTSNHQRSSTTTARHHPTTTSLYLINNNDPERPKQTPRIQRYPFSVLMVQAMRVLREGVAGRGNGFDMATAAISSSVPAAAAAVAAGTTTTMGDPPLEKTAQPSPPHQPLSLEEQIFAQARFQLQLDQGVRAAFGFPLEITLSNTNNDDHPEPILLSSLPHQTTIHNNNTMIELALQVQGHNGCSGVALALASPQDGLVRLILYVSPSPSFMKNKNRVLHISLKKPTKKPKG